jgi:hypothetical protein
VSWQEPGVALIASLPVRSGRRLVPIILEVADLDLRGWPADRRPERKRGGDHEAAVVSFERTSMGMFPADVKSTSKLFSSAISSCPIGVLMMRSLPDSRCAATSHRSTSRRHVDKIPRRC